MLRSITLLASLLVAGCACQAPEFTRPQFDGEPWDTTYLIDLDPEALTLGDLDARADHLNDLYWKYSQVNGVLWPAWRTDGSKTMPDRYNRTGDSALFTGQMLATSCFKYMSTLSDESLDEVEKSLQGVFLVTHATGVPGVICRQAFPNNQAAKFGFPDEWGDRIDRGFVNTGPALEGPLGWSFTPHTYYTRATKDQLTGIVFGLAALQTALKDTSDLPGGHTLRAQKLKDAATSIIEAVYLQLIEHNWDIRDENGNNDTSADHVDGLLRTALLAVMVHSGFTNLQGEYENEFDSFYALSRVLAFSDKFNNFQQYFAYNLRTSRAMSIWLLEGAYSERGDKMAHYVSRNIWQYTSGHQNAWFAFATAAMVPADEDAVEIGVSSLKSLSLKPTRMWMSPYAGQEHKPGLGSVTAGCSDVYVVPPHLRKPEDYSTWQKEPWDVGKLFSDGSWDFEGLGEASGLDFLLAYWLGQAFDLF